MEFSVDWKFMPFEVKSTRKQPKMCLRIFVSGVAAKIYDVEEAKPTNGKHVCTIEGTLDDRVLVFELLEMMETDQKGVKRYTESSSVAIPLSKITGDEGLALEYRPITASSETLSRTSGMIEITNVKIPKLSGKFKPIDRSTIQDLISQTVKFIFDESKYKPIIPAVKRMHVPRYRIQNDIDLPAASFVYVQPLKPLDESTLYTVIATICLKYGKDIASFESLLSKDVKMTENEYFLAAAMVGDILTFTATNFKYMSDLIYPNVVKKAESVVEEVPKAFDTEQFKISRLTGAGDCEDGAKEIQMFTKSIMSINEPEIPVVINLIRFLNNFHVAMMTCCSLVGSMNELGTGNPDYRNHIFAMLLPDHWVKYMTGHSMLKNDLTIEMLGSGRTFYPIVLEATGMALAVPYERLRVTHYTKFYERYTEIRKYMGVGQIVGSDPLFYKYLVHAWCDTIRPDAIDFMFIDQDKMGLPYSNAVRLQTPNTKLVPIYLVDENDVDTLKRMLYRYVVPVPQWTSPKLKGDAKLLITNNFPPRYFTFESPDPIVVPKRVNQKYLGNVTHHMQTDIEEPHNIESNRSMLFLSSS